MLKYIQKATIINSYLTASKQKSTDGKEFPSYEIQVGTCIHKGLVLLVTGEKKEQYQHSPKVRKTI